MLGRVAARAEVAPALAALAWAAQGRGMVVPDTVVAAVQELQAADQRFPRRVQSFPQVDRPAFHRSSRIILVRA